MYAEKMLITILLISQELDTKMLTNTKIPMQTYGTTWWTIIDAKIMITKKAMYKYRN